MRGFNRTYIERAGPILTQQSEADLRQFLYGGLIGLCVLVFIAAIWLALFMAAAKLAERSCHATAQAMQLESRYSLYTGCMVKVNDMWWPLKSLGI